MTAEPGGGVAAERHDLGAGRAGGLDDLLHQPARRAGAAQRERRLDMKDRQDRAVAPVAGEDDLPVDLELVPAALGVVAYLIAHLLQISRIGPLRNRLTPPCAALSGPRHP